MTMAQRPHLETIQEESEKEDETAGSETGGEEEEEDFPFQVDEETDEMLAEDESEDEEEEEEDAPLRVLRPGRGSCSISKENFTRMQSSNNHLEEMEDSSVSGESTHVEDLSDEASPSGQAKSGNEKRFSFRELRMKVPKIRWQRQQPKPAVQKRKKKHKMKILGDKPFQQWLVDLMIDIEEATTHQLVVE